MNTSQNKLDLHGIRHQDVPLMVENFVLLNQDKCPLTIICGKSNKMLGIVQQTLDSIDVQQTSTLNMSVIKVLKI